MTQRALLLHALVEHAAAVPPSDDPVVVSRKRLGLPVRPSPRKRGYGRLVNFTLTGEEKDVVEAEATERMLSLTDFVTALLRLAQSESTSSSS